MVLAIGSSSRLRMVQTRGCGLEALMMVLVPGSVLEAYGSRFV